MVQTLTTYEEALNLIGALPTMDPRPNATNIHAVDRHLDERLSTIPSFQWVTLGYAGMAKKAELYVLGSTVPWVDFKKSRTSPAGNIWLTRRGGPAIPTGHL